MIIELSTPHVNGPDNYCQYQQLQCSYNALPQQTKDVPPRVRTSYNGEKLISNKMSLSEVTTMAIRNGKWSLCFCIGVGYGGSGLDTDASWKAASDNAAAFVPTAGPGHPCHRLIWGPCL